MKGRMKARTIVMALAVLAIAVPACADAGEPTTSSPPPTSSPDDQTPSPTETSPAGSPTPAAELEDGRHFGYIESIDPDAREMVFDLAYLLTGDEANQAAEEHGDEVPVPNDYYVVNDNPRLRTLMLATRVRVFVFAGGTGPELEPGDFDAFVDGFETNDFDGRYHGSVGSYWVVVRGGRVVKIEEQWFP